ncbi:hypothetical protein L9F63_005737 [Diploptera punctata]|uniref:Uncharacterized protein n=1 Tax=Diploptera punctata TaxID=6984 RepID=A0AAD7ZC93_DIPPU|nr:hypothetical protein L9F63_005737 [Diploptera punctata]
MYQICKRNWKIQMHITRKQLLLFALEETDSILLQPIATESSWSDTIVDCETGETVLQDPAEVPVKHDVKIIVIGNSGVGKTSFIKRFTHHHFLVNYRTTVGVDFFSKTIATSYGYVTLNIHDIAGQDRSGFLCRSFYKKCNGVIICYDLTNKQSLNSVKNWVSHLDSVVCPEDGSVTPRILVGNKCDIDERRDKSKTQMVKFAQENKFSAWFEVSAKTGKNVDDAFMALVRLIFAMKDNIFHLHEDTGIINLKREKQSRCIFNCS